VVRSEEGAKAPLLGRKRQSEYLVVRGSLLRFAEYPKFHAPILSRVVERCHELFGDGQCRRLSMHSCFWYEGRGITSSAIGWPR
jgi:hypothetical protein